MNHTAFAPAKTIIIGDHTIVHSGKGYVVPLKIGITIILTKGSGQITTNLNSKKVISFIKMQIAWFDVNIHSVNENNFNLEIISEVPISVGLGSSTALTTALFSVLLSYKKISYTDDLLYKYVINAERESYTVSGIDQSVIVYNSPLIVEKKEQGTLAFKKATEHTLLSHLVLISSGPAVEATSEMVAIFAKAKQEKPLLFKEMVQISEEFVFALDQNHFSFDLLQSFGDALVGMGVVGDIAKDMIAQLKEMGAGAKTTAAGGKKNGSGMLLVWHEDQKKLYDFLESKKWDYFPLLEGN